MELVKKSQAALEFIMTYGWAILVVLVAIGALAYFGVLSPDKFLPSRCTLSAGLACMDHAATNFLGIGFGEVIVVIKNSLGYDIKSVSISATKCSSSTTTSLLKNGDRVTLTASDCNINSGERYSGQVNITYTNVDSGITHTLSGNIVTKVRSEII